MAIGSPHLQRGLSDLLKARSFSREPLAYGCLGQETTGADSFAKALRHVPVLEARLETSAEHMELPAELLVELSG